MFLQQNLDVWNGIGIRVECRASSDLRLHYFEPFLPKISPSLLSMHQIMSGILKYVSKPTSAAASITIIISNKIALFNNSSSRIYPFIYYQHADHISISFLARVLDDPFQSGSHQLFRPSVRRVIWASLRSVNVTRTTPRTSATTP